MRKTANILGLASAVSVVLVLIVLVAIYPDAILGFVFAPLVGVLAVVCLVSVPIMALGAVSYGQARPQLSAVLYFVATPVGLLFLYFTGAVLTDWAWGFLLVLPVVPLPVAGALMVMEGRAAGLPGVAG